MMKHAFTVLTALLLAPLAAAHADDSAAKKPNALFVIFDVILALSRSAKVAGIERPASSLSLTVPGLRIESRAYPEHAATQWRFWLKAPEAGERFRPELTQHEPHFHDWIRNDDALPLLH